MANASASVVAKNMKDFFIVPLSNKNRHTNMAVGELK